MKWPNILPFLLVLATGMLTAQQEIPRDEHRIGIKKIGGKAQFFDRRTGEVFVPRGFNYIQLVLSPNGPYGESALFLDDSHNLLDIDSDFQRMAALGYNSVRVFIDLCRGERCIADEQGLVDSYMDHIVELLERARQYDLQVMLTANWLPDLGGYSGPAHEICHSTGDFEGGNCLVLSPKGVELYVKFFEDFIRELKKRDAPFNHIWAYELRNEFFVENNIPPFTLERSVTAANGKTYNMNTAVDKEKLAREGLKHWANTITLAIKDLDPSSLVCSGFFTPSDPIDLRPGDHRIVPFMALLSDSELDFFDIHMYPGFEPMEEHITNYGIENFTEKPVVLGEYGSFLPLAPSEYPAAVLSERWEAAACQAGLDGYLYWTWERHQLPVSNPDDPWGGNDAGAFIGKVLSPAYKTDPCTAQLPETNVSQGKTANASMAWKDEFKAANVVDGKPVTTPWIAGSDPPQWVEVDLGKNYDLESIVIFVETGSDDPHYYEHEILVSTTGTGNNYRKIHHFKGKRVNFESLTYKPEDGIKNVRRIRVRIPAAPGWAALHELQAFIPEQREVYDVPPPPVIVFPRPGLDKVDNNQDIKLQWDNEVETTNSQVQIARDIEFSDIIIDERFDKKSYVFDAGLFENPLYWRVRQRNKHGYGVWSVAGIITNVLTAAGDILNDNEIMLYPNPAGDVVRIKAREKDATGTRFLVQIYSLEGRKMLVEPLPTFDGGDGIHIKHLAPGMYIVKVEKGEEAGYFRLVKQ